MPQDIIIIGAGITGSMIARELSRYHLNVLVIEKCNDVGNKTSNANSAIIHSGYDPEPGTNKAKFNVLGNKMYDQICKDLDVKFMRIGSLTIAMDEEQLKTLEELKKRSEANGVDVHIISKEELHALEPNINPEAIGALLAPSAGIIDPFTLTVHCMENACDNGVELKISTEVKEIKKLDNGNYLVKTNNGDFETKVVINAAGNYADKIASMVEDIDWSITARKGEYFVLDHFKWGFVNHTIFPLPSKKGKGVLVTMTTSGDYLVGPSAEPTDKEDYSTDKNTLDAIKANATLMVPNIPFQHLIRTFSGLRPTCSRHDFIIEYSKNDNHFINVAGIESPGLASAPAIAQYVVDELVKPIMELKEKEDYVPTVRKRYSLSDYKDEEFFKTHPEYNEMVCFCEKVSLGQIKDELSRSVPPRSVKGVKRRTRAGFGKCQGGFCSTRVVLELAKHYGVSPTEIPLDDVGSNILTSKVKEVA